MPKIIQIRNVPDALHRKLMARAADSGVSLSAYLLAEMCEIVALPTLTELQERIASRMTVELPVSTAVMIRAVRGD